MKYIKQLIILGFLTITSTHAQADKCEHQNDAKNTFRPVQELFAAVSAFDHDKMRAVATDDFQLLEVGEDWSMEDFTNAVKEGPFVRRNYFHVIKSNVNGDVAWISYWNKATILNTDTKPDSNKGKVKVEAWLESAVMVKTKDGWKVQLLHSTYIEAEKLPKDAEFCEFTG